MLALSIIETLRNFIITVIEQLSNFIITVIEQLGYAGVFVGMTLESVGVPLPSEVIMPFAGYVVWEGKLTLIGVTLAGTLGCLVGSLIAYGIGAFGGRPLLERYGRYVLIRTQELDLAEEWFKKYGEGAVFVSRLLPVFRTYISYPAGIVRMDVKRFSVYTVLGSLPFCFALGYVGVALGPHWEDIRGLFSTSISRSSWGWWRLSGTSSTAERGSWNVSAGAATKGFEKKAISARFIDDERRPCP